MPQFDYRALTAEGEKIDGRMEAADRRAALQRLQAEGLIPIEARPVTGLPAAAASAAPAPAVLSTRRAGRVTAVTRELAILLEAGEPLASALATVIEDLDDRPLQAALQEVLEKVRGGGALSEALAEHPRLFPRLYIGMVRAGEATGRLGATLDELAAMREREEAQARRMSSAMIYPLILALTAIGSVILMLAVVVPQFAPLFAGRESVLPGNARLVLAVSAGLAEHGIAIAVVALGLLLFVMLALRTPGARTVMDRLVLRLPILGPLARERATAQVGRGLATMLQGGLDLPATLALLSDMVANSAVAAALRRSVVAVREGRRLAEVLGEEDILVPMALRMLRTGEDSGKLKELARHVAERFEQRVAVRLTRVMALIEPLLVITLGIVVGGIVLSILTAVLAVNEIAF